MTTRKFLLAATVTVLTWTTVQGYTYDMMCASIGTEYLEGMSFQACVSAKYLGKGLVSAYIATEICRDDTLVLAHVNTKVSDYQI